MGLELITATPAARQRIAEILDNAEGADGIRIGIKNGGCAGMEYTVDLTDGGEKGDDLVSFDQGKIYIDAKAILFLLGTEIDFETTKFRSGFVFNNPNQTSACGCGESVELKAATLPEGAALPR
ncbi:MAG: iron-sulfur cluster assembly accessory protein [Rhizobiales bacterium]|nr:iron-sulfur cluster assembly accessory protein [Hyphomicrobiales bacterium]